MTTELYVKRIKFFMFDGYSLSLSQVKSGVTPGRVVLMKRIRENEEFKRMQMVYKKYNFSKRKPFTFSSFKDAWSKYYPDDIDLSIDTNLIEGKN